MLGEKGSSKADTLVKVVLVFFISLLSFSVGTFVGKQVSDSEHRKIALEGEFKGEGREIASEKEEHAEGAGKISDKEVASLTEEFVNKEGKEGDEHHAEAAHDAKPDADGYKTYARESKGRDIASDEGHDVKVETHDAHDPHADAKPAEHAAEHTAPAKHEEKAADATHHAAEKIAEGKAPSDGETEVKKPAAAAELPSVANSAVGKYTVQVASYATEKEAKDHAAKLKEKGFQAFYLSAKVNNKDWYRVLVGLFSSVKSADEYKAQLIKDGGTKAAYVQKIVQ